MELSDKADEKQQPSAADEKVMLPLIGFSLIACNIKSFIYPVRLAFVSVEEYEKQVLGVVTKLGSFWV